MRLKQLLTLLILVFSSLPALAQIKSFGKEPEVFIKELKVLMFNDDIEPAKAVYEEFKVLWDSSRFDQYQQSRIIKNADKMLTKRMKAHPHFSLYLRTLIDFYNSGKMNEQFVLWQKTFESYYPKKTKEMQDYLESCQLMFSANTFVESKANRIWAADNNSWKLDVIGDEPVFVFEKLNIVCRTREDSLFIQNTKGMFGLESHTWKGVGGKVDWTRGNYDPEKVNAVLKRYTIDMNSNEYMADSVTFINSEYFSTPLMGRLHDVALATSNPETTRYPKFFSYKKDIKIDKFAQDVKYVGGFSQQGSKIVAYGEGGQLGTFIFSYKNKPFIYLSGMEFVVTDERLITDKAAMVINLDTGAINHPQVQVNYVKADKKLICSRGDVGVSQAPFNDEYHRLELKADKFEWIMGQPKVEFKTILKDGSVLLYSENFFREFDYEKIQGMQAIHPLAKLKQFCEQTGKRTFHLSEYVTWLQSKREYVRFQIVQLTDAGYLMLDSETDTIKVNEKLFNAVNAHMGRTDYDIIFFESIIEKRPNATLNLENYHMDLEGVGRFRFSDSQYVYVIPNDQKVTVLRNRELVFDGKVRAGRFEFFGQRFRFNYQSFSVDMDDIDSMRLFFPDENDNLKKVNSVLQDITGTLFIDNPNNKSGRKDFPEYPIFKATKSSKVFYDYPYIYNGVYDRERFYFQTDPFIIDSLDNFTREGLRFAGTFVSADIFPDFREELTVQEDFSLGFKKTLSMPTYQGAGVADVDLSLSNLGLLAKGKINFETSVTQSQDIVFFPDSMNAVADRFDVPAGPNYPEVHGVNLTTHWEPYKDRMEQRTGATPITMYGDVKLTGTYVHAKKQAGGIGSIDFNDGQILSNNMTFDAKRMKADTSTLIIRSIDTTKFAFRAVNVKSDMNFENRIGNFVSNVDGANAEFPYNQYKSSLNEFKWDIKKKNLNFRTPPSKPIEKTYFVSTHPDQDSLQFSSRKALYDLSTFTLFADEVPHINVADSRVIPDSGKVVIRADAAMDVLHHAKIELDTLNKYHKFYECNVGIMGRYNFGADGLYTYTNKKDQKFEVNFHEIKVDYLSKTAVAYGDVFDTMHFELTPRFEFKGRLTAVGSYRGLDFDGHVHPIHSLSRPGSGWWRDHRKYVPDSVLFHIDKPINEDKNPLKVGFALTIDSVHAYPAYFTLGRNYSDSSVLDAGHGIVYWDEAQQKFFTGDSLKLAGGSFKGNYVYLDDKNGIMYGEGATCLGINTTEGFDIKSAGNVTFYHKDSSIHMDLMMLMDFKLPKETMKIFTDKMVENAVGLNATNNSREMVKPALAELLSPDNFNDALKNLTSGSIPIYKETEASIFISQVKLVWDQERKAWISEGKIGITAIAGTKIEKMVTGKLMIERKRSGDEITFYFETGGDHWYYMNFLRRNMYVYSSEDAYNNSVREFYQEVSKDGYTLKLASPRAKIKFLNSFEPKE